MVTREEVHAALGQVMDPDIHKPITELDMVRDVSIDPVGVVTVQVLLTIPGCPLKDRITREVTAAVSPLPGVSGVVVDLGTMTEEQRQAMVTRLRGGQQQPQKTISFWGDDSSTRVLAVASGKGGVGKSSVTVNLAAALAAQGHRVAVIDCDIYGFSVPRMLGATGRPVGFNGMIMLLVTTPQEAAERVAVLAGRFALQNQMKVAGVVENMSYFVCPNCDERHHIFGQGGGDALARELGTELLGRVPLDVRLREGGDTGKPLVLSDPDAPASQALLAVAGKLPPRRRSLVGKRPTL